MLPAIVLLTLAMTACQVNLDVATKVNEDGSGTITIGAGFDDAALRRFGNPSVNIATDDLKAAGWELTTPVKEADGFTWIRATRRFATPEEATQILKQYTGDQGSFRDFAITKESTLGRTTWNYAGKVDLTGGLAAFGDAEAAAVLNGDPFGGQVAAVEQEEQQPVSEMFTLTMSVELPGGEKREWRPSFADPEPTQLSALSTQTQPVPVLPASGSSAAIFIAGGVIVVGAVALMMALRSRFRRY